jgi:hypothetical protein
MKQVCPLSGVIWEAEGFVTGHKPLVLAHPIFALPVKSLYARLDADWYAGRLSQIEKKLLFLAIFNASGHVTFNHPADPEPAIVETHIAALAKSVSWLLSIKHPGLSAPHFSINRETHKLENMSALLQAWAQARLSFESGMRAQNLLATKNRLEMLLENRIKRVEAGIVAESASYLAMLASWAEIALNFPSFATIHPRTFQNIKLCDYWKELIACPESEVYSYPLADWKELDDHIVDNLDDTDSSFAFTLMRRIKKVVYKQSDDIGLVIVRSQPSAAGAKATYTLEPNASDKATMAAIAAKAPSSEPIASSYASKVDFLRAKIAWNMAKRLGPANIHPSNNASITVEAPEVKAEDL